jgi:hypothetical protein
VNFTIRHEFVVSQQLSRCRGLREMFRVGCRVELQRSPNTFRSIQIVRQSDAMAIKNFKHFVLTIAVKGGPLDRVRFMDGPIEEGGFIFVSDAELSTYAS